MTTYWAVAENWGALRGVGETPEVCLRHWVEEGEVFGPERPYSAFVGVVGTDGIVSFDVPPASFGRTSGNKP